MSKQAKQEKAIGEILVIRCLTGALIGVAASTLITVFISAIIGDGNYYPVSPDLVSACGSELKAIILQTLFDLLYGAAFGGAGLIWTLDWSLLKQTLVHLVICSGATFPIAWLMHWMTHTTAGVLSYFGIFFAIYAGIWCLLALSARKSVDRMNEELEKGAGTKGGQ